MQKIRNKPRTKLNVISHTSLPFSDRTEAGYLLAEQLVDLRDKKAVVLGIPRGGIIVARALASKIGAELDIVLARKLGAPGQPELAMGALAEDGKVFLNQDVVRGMSLTKHDVAQERARQMKEIERRTQLIRAVLPKRSLKNKIVVVTDDGVATGATMQAALWAVKQENPKKLIAAIPVASAEALEKLRPDADEIICLRQPPVFYSVGQFYNRFDQVEDAEILRILKADTHHKKRIKNR
jgi:putative phosphoribosyl transferase